MTNSYSDLSYFEVNSKSEFNLGSLNTDVIVIREVLIVSDDIHDLFYPVKMVVSTPNGVIRQRYFHPKTYYSNYSTKKGTDRLFNLIVQDCKNTIFIIDAIDGKEITLRFGYESVKRKKIKIKQTLSFEYIDELYKTLYSSGDFIDIELPDTIKENTFAALPSLIQFLSTWIRYSRLGDLYFKIDPNKKNPYEEIIENYLSFCGVVLAWKRDIKNQNNESIKDELVKHTSKVFRKMMFIEPAKNATILLANIDHETSKRGLLDSFYNVNKHYISHPDELEFTVLKMLSGIRKINANMLSKNTSDILEDLKVIIFELMKNTDDWAKDDHLGKLLLPNIRALYVKYHKNFQKNFIEYSEGNNGLNNYLKHDIFKQNRLGQIYFLEVTVVDSGPGFVKRYLGKDYNNPTLEQQIDVIKECLVKNSTSSLEAYKKKGQGLDRILQTIDKKGFIYIKTSNVAVYRDLVVDNHKLGATKTDIKLYDWKTCKSDRFTATFPTEGSLVSIIYPVDPYEEGGIVE